ncbi:MAG: SDR family oxidoreductase [Candidatus Brocadiae bacterium]|nr:SDR family oxidoreductase [Candidatus Brocadiia bacterium]
MAHFFITGSTGQVGAFVAKELLEKGHRLSLLVRGPKAQDRIQNVFNTIGVTSSNYEVWEGDLFSLPFPINGIDCILHSAAELSFDPSQKEKVWHTNFEGTKNILAWAHQSKIPSFHYVSTAYIAGNYEGTYNEESLDFGQTFRNEYEKSKLFTEKMCREFCQKQGINLAVYRPGIIMGTSSGKSLHYQGYYIFLKVLSELYEKYHTKENPQENIYCMEGKLHLPIRIEANAQGKKHLVFLDYVAKAISTILLEARTTSQTLYLLPTHPPTNQQTLEWVEKALGLCGLSLVSSLEGKTLNRLERLVHHYIHVYKNYLEKEPDFEYHKSVDTLSSLGVLCPSLDNACFERWIVYGKKDRWGRKEKEEKNKEIPLQNLYFQKFLPLFLDKPFLSGKVTCNFAVCLKEDSHGFWKLTLQQGILKALESTKSQEGLDFWYTLSQEVFHEIIAGKLDPRYAFFSGKTDILGDMEHGLKVATVLREFFQKNPWQQPS